MNTQPGWYDAGVPGRERWWDGTQWTAHERDVPPSTPAPASPQTAGMAWYSVPGTSDVRWWDGTGWTPYRLRDTGPRPDAFAVEPGGTGLGLGVAFVVVGFVQFGTSQLSGQPFFAITPVLFLVAGVIWLIGGVHVTRVRKLPAPRTGPVFDASARPLPGEVEGSAAGWYPVSGPVVRWWTGARWSAYVGQKVGVRPTQYGPRSYRASLIIAGVITAVGVVATVLGFLLMFAAGQTAGLGLVIPGMIALVAGPLVLLLVYVRRHTLILPTEPPQVS